MVGNDADTDFQLYQKGKKESINQRWELAIDWFQELIDTYPDSRYQDDAVFWVAYCLEKKLHRYKAFDKFKSLIDSYPLSPWVDDALVHQIGLAEDLFEIGDKSYKGFLVKQLNHENETIRQHAVFALGRIGDKKALPYLKQYVTSESLREMAQFLIRKIESGLPVVSEIEHVDSEDKDKYPEIRTFGDLVRDLKARRQAQYQKMLKEGVHWSQDELINFAMWTILPDEQHHEYFALTGYDRQEWLRKYWKQRDPTPTTEDNECYQEFLRRLEYANNQYGELWDFGKARYLKDQYLQVGWPHAPWDARGEIYIKYGEPDFRTIAGYQEEEWNYYRYNVDFIIKQYVTNVFGNAVKPGPLSESIYSHDLGYVEKVYISNPEFRYHHDYQSKPFKGFMVSFENGSYAQKGNVILNYSVPAKEFKSKKAKGQYDIEYLQRLVIFDEDMRELHREESVKELKNSAKFKKDNVIHGVIPLNLKPGNYILALRIADRQSDKLGIFVETLRIEE
jgi:GWxTD domain-containing protein